MKAKLLILWVIVLLPLFAAAQQPAKKPTPTPDPNFLKWRIFLDTLAQEARGIPDDRRPYATTDVALAYWEYDRDEAKKMLFSALDEAYKFRAQDKKKYDPMLMYVLRASARHTSEISGELAARLRKLVEDNNKDKTDKDKDPLEPENELLNGVRDDDPSRRAALAKSIAPRGLKEGTSAITLILNLAQKDQAIADDVYKTYLQRASADKTIPIGALIQMAGYSIGYGEYYYYSDGSWSTGTTGATMLKPDPTLAPQFFGLIYQRIKAAVDAAGEGATIGLSEAPPILFILQLLSPEVESRTPGLFPAWQQLEQEAVIGQTPDKIKAAGDRVANVLKSRARYLDPSTPLNMDDEVDAMLADIDKVTGTCQRDLIYSRAALNLVDKNPKRALDLIGKVDDKARAANLTDILYGRRVEKELENGDFDAAGVFVEKISSPMVKTAAWADIGSSLFKKKQLIEGGKAVDSGAKLIEKMEPNDRAGAYFGMAVLLSGTDPREAVLMLENGIKNLNKSDPLDAWPVRNTMEIKLTCPNSQGSSSSAWGADFGNSDVFGAVTRLARQDLDGVNSATDSISDKATRVRSRAIVAKAALAKYKPQ